MDAITIFAALGSTVLLLGAAARLPAAAAEVVRACIILVQAVADLRNTARRAFSAQPELEDTEPAPLRAQEGPEEQKSEDNSS
ncbi:hypothetical protein ACFVZA_10410 [Streptomyces bottropensis]|uniref:hypothetical protein n=1 Tax=Streptomyces bottropensis TaxID=42235 RepID=UPI0036BF5ABD